MGRGTDRSHTSRNCSASYVCILSLSRYPPYPPMVVARPFPCLPVVSPIYYYPIYLLFLYSIISFTFSYISHLLLIALAFILPYLPITQTTVSLLAATYPLLYIYYRGPSCLLLTIP